MSIDNRYDCGRATGWQEAWWLLIGHMKNVAFPNLPEEFSWGAREHVEKSIGHEFIRAEDFHEGSEVLDLRFSRALLITVKPPSTMFRKGSKISKRYRAWYRRDLDRRRAEAGLA